MLPLYRSTKTQNAMDIFQLCTHVSKNENKIALPKEIVSHIFDTLNAIELIDFLDQFFAEYLKYKSLPVSRSTLMRDLTLVLHGTIGLWAESTSEQKNRFSHEAFQQVSALYREIAKDKQQAGIYLYFAAYFGCPRILGGLVNVGLDVNAPMSGCTVLLPAVRYCSPETVEILIAAGADLRNKDKDGKTALQIAQNLDGGETMVKLLEKAMEDESALRKKFHIFS